MRCAARKEMEYLGAIRGRNPEEASLAQELGRRLDALRRYDQYFCDGDWRPRSRRGKRAKPKESSD